MDEYLAEHPPQPAHRPVFAGPPAERGRRIVLPVVLFVLTCLSTLYVGGLDGVKVDDTIIEVMDWKNGLLYMTAVMSILLAHEMGHFLQALRHRIPASLPFFIPLPLPPVGTMGAVIGMRGSEADRRQLFDIGLTGPWAGLLIAIPVAWYGVKTAVPITEPLPPNSYQFNDPLLFKLLIGWLHPNLPEPQIFHKNPFYMAGWVGMLITGLNMLPVSQLDGGHTAYALFGRKAHLLARGVILAAVAFMVYLRQPQWGVMLFLVMLIGVDHPPTADDRVELGLSRKIIGFVSLVIPIFCLAPIPIS